MGRNLKDRIKDIEMYKPFIQFIDGNFVVTIKYKKGWTILEPENKDIIAFSKDDSKPHTYWYLSTIDNIDMIFDLIEETIDVNKIMEKKVEFYKEKVKELQSLILSDIPYEKVVTLKYYFQDETPKKKKSTPRTTKQNKQTTKEEETNMTTNMTTDMTTNTDIQEVQDMVCEEELEACTPTSIVYPTSDTDKEQYDSEIDNKIAQIIG